ncbi:MAG: cupredoxin domain-containing protein [Planctomycetota bacterium]|jgi:heme/copper-type cytochrome/quinol oxidase subunit 2
MRFKRLLFLSLFAGLALGIFAIPAMATAEPTTHEVVISAEQFSFNPSVMRVNLGDQVSITLQASDVAHGFYLDGYEIQARTEPGLSQRIEFIADREGKFRFRCSVICGELHPFMIGELVVRPNSPFQNAVGFLLISFLGTLGYLWLFPTTKQPY